ncbi:MAG: hypothetical protein ABSE63_00820 [Thermoguttaceae bacterium]|jgi:hypothetical protein
MNRLWVLLVIIVAFPALIMAQPAPQYSGSSGSPPPYQPAVPAPSIVNGYGGWSGYGGTGASTAAGSAMNGMASVISAKGNYNLSTSAAAVNMTQAQKQEIQNRQQWTNTYFDMRATNRAARKAEEGPQPTMEQLARMAHDGAPKPLTSSQWNPVTGTVNWPALLEQDQFTSQRAELEQLLAKQAKYGMLDYSDQMKARQTIETMFAGLKAQIRDVPPQDWAASQTYLKSLIYAMTKTDLS